MVIANYNVGSHQQGYKVKTNNSKIEIHIANGKTFTEDEALELAAAIIVATQTPEN